MRTIRHSGRARVFTLALALSLAATACGTGDDTAAETVSAPVDDAAAQSATPSAPATDASSSDSDPTEAVEAEGSDEVAAPIENLFPDVDVLNVADGSTVNLAAELGGDDRPTLLWFWAPH